MAEFRGKGRTMKTAATFIAEHDFWFGGRLVPKGSRCRQWETRNFGWTQWVEPDGSQHIASE